MNPLITRSDIESQLSARRHKGNYVYRPLSKPDAQVVAPAEPAAIIANSWDFAEDFIAEHSSSSRVLK